MTILRSLCHLWQCNSVPYISASGLPSWWPTLMAPRLPSTLTWPSPLPSTMQPRWPIRGQYLCHVIIIDQSQAAHGSWVPLEGAANVHPPAAAPLIVPAPAIYGRKKRSAEAQVTNQGPVLRLRDLYWPIRGQYSCHVTCVVDLSEVTSK